MIDKYLHRVKEMDSDIDQELEKEYGRNANHFDIKKFGKEMRETYSVQQLQRFEKLKHRYNKLINQNMSYQRAKEIVGFGIEEKK